MINQSIVEIVSEWDIVAARQLGRSEAKEIGFNTVDQAKITTVISELAKSIFLYSSAGEISIERVTDGDRIGIRIKAVDKNGVTGVRSVRKEVFSTAKGLDAELSGMERLMDNLEIKSGIGRGTIIVTEKWLK